MSGKGNVSFPVYAAAGGVVTKSYARDTGTMVTILHAAAAPGGQRFCTRYLHLNSSKVNVRSGQTVSAGQQIAWSGNTGTGTIHLHFDVKVGGCGGAYPRVDPFDIAGKLIKARTAPVMDYYPQNSRFSGCGSNSLVKSCSLR